MTFIPLGWLDPYELACSLRSRIGLFSRSGMVRMLPIRGPRGDADPDDDTAFAWAKGREKWPELMNMLSQIERMGNGGWVWGRIGLELLMPGGIRHLESDLSAYAERFTRAHVALRTNPGAVLFCGGAAKHLLPGEIAALGTLRPPKPPAPTGAVNLGDGARIHLVVDFRKKDDPE